MANRNSQNLVKFGEQIKSVTSGKGAYTDHLGDSLENPLGINLAVRAENNRRVEQGPTNVSGLCRIPTCGKKISKERLKAFDHKVFTCISCQSDIEARRANQTGPGYFHNQGR